MPVPCPLQLLLSTSDCRLPPHCHKLQPRLALCFLPLELGYLPCKLFQPC